MTTNTCNAVMQMPYFNHCSWFAQNTNAGASSIPDYIPLCDIRATQKPSVGLYDDSCCSSLWGFGYGGLCGSQTGFALDTTTANKVYSKSSWGDILDGGLKQGVLSFFNGAQNSFFAMGSNPQVVLGVGSSLLKGVGGLFGGIGNMFSGNKTVN